MNTKSMQKLQSVLQSAVYAIDDFTMYGDSFELLNYVYRDEYTRDEVNTARVRSLLNTCKALRNQANLMVEILTVDCED
jgi:hypothetical protein